jgi:hypothetical protein
MATALQVDTKQEVQRKQCSMCGRTTIYPVRMKEPWASLILWQEYEGMVICAKCFVCTRAA